MFRILSVIVFFQTVCLLRIINPALYLASLKKHKAPPKWELMPKKFLKHFGLIMPNVYFNLLMTI